MEVENNKRTETFGRRKRKWDNNIKMHLQEMQ
jgi:hypothetical protein